MAASTDKWRGQIKLRGRMVLYGTNIDKKRLLKKFEMGNISIGNETVDNWKIAWKILRMKLQQRLQRNKMERLSQKNMQSEIPRNHTKATMDG